MSCDGLLWQNIVCNRCALCSYGFITLMKKMVVSIFSMVGVLDAKYISGLGANCTSRLLFLLFITKYFVFVKWLLMYEYGLSSLSLRKFACAKNNKKKKQNIIQPRATAIAVYRQRKGKFSRSRYLLVFTTNNELCYILLFFLFFYFNFVYNVVMQ